MTRAQERLGRRLARAIRGIEFSAGLVADGRCDADLIASGHGGVRVEVRHPDVERDGYLWLVAIVALEPEVELTYAVPVYREALEQVVRRVAAVRRVA